MEIKTVLTCPFQSKCEEIKDNAIHKCVFFIELEGKNPQNGEFTKEKGCAISWLPILMIENSQQQRQTSAAVESFRNEMIKSQEEFINLSLSSNINLLNS